MSLLEGIIDSRNNPLAVVEDIAADNNWSFERSGEDEVTIVSKGDWTDYQLSFTWMTEIEALHLACAFDMKIPAPRRAEVQRLIAAINEQLWVGHFDIWTHTGMIMYRQALVLPGGITASTAQCESMLVGAIHACERYYPAFQFVVWAGKIARRSHECGDVRHRGRGVGVFVPTQSSRASRDPYAVTPGVRVKCLWPRPSLQQETPVVMGPGFRGDDEVFVGGVLEDIAMNDAQPLAQIKGTIVLAGAGKMGGAMLSGWLAQGLDAKRVAVIEPHPSAEISALVTKGIRLNPSPKDDRRRRHAGGRAEAADVPRSRPRC